MDTLRLWIKRMYAAVAESRKKVRLKSNRAVFSNVYRKNMWGVASPENSVPFYSGPGSSDPQIVNPYVETVKRFFSSLPAKKNAVDLGCGDFQVGSKIFGSFDSYTACDDVPELIRFNQRYWNQLSVKFKVVDLVKDEIPYGEVLILRQVLQHLSNHDIFKFIQMIPSEFTHLLVTEHLPKGNSFLPNINKISGPDIRLGSGSSVVLTQPPFNLKIKSEITLFSVPQLGGSIVTTLYELQSYCLCGFSSGFLVANPKLSSTKQE